MIAEAVTTTGVPYKGKGKGLDTCYRATYMSGLVTAALYNLGSGS